MDSFIDTRILSIGNHNVSKYIRNESSKKNRTYKKFD